MTSPAAGGRRLKDSGGDSPPRIILVMHSYPWGSPFLRAKFRGLQGEMLDVHLVCLHGRRPRRNELDPVERGRVHVAWSRRSHLAAALLILVALFRSLARNPRGTWRYLREGFRRFGTDVVRRFYLDAEIIGLRPDVLHFEFGTVGVDRIHLGELLAAKVIVSFRGYDLNYIGLESENHYGGVWREADALHFLGHALWHRAQQRGCPPDKPHALIPPAVDGSFFDPGEPEAPAAIDLVPAKDGMEAAEPLRVLSVGRVVWEKGYEYGLESVRILLDRGIPCKYRIVGDGDHLRAVAYAIHQLGLARHVELIGRGSRTEVRDHLRWADVFLQASVSEGFCNAVVEAQAMEVPVVCTDAGGLPENVADARTGFVVGRREAAGLAARMAELAADAELRDRMGREARRRVLDRFQLEDQIRAFRELYQRCLADRSSVDAGRARD